MTNNSLRRRAEMALDERGSGLWKCGKEPQVTAHELEVYAIELEMQNESLLEAQVHVEDGLQRYADLYDFAPAGYFTLERDGAIRELNLAAAALLGAERSRLVGGRFGVFVAESSRGVFHRFLEETFASHERATCSVELALEGRPSAFVSVTATLSPSGTECRMVAMDVTDRERMEDRLRATEERFHLLVDAVQDYALYLLDLEGRVESWNRGAAALKGYPEAEIVGRDFSVFYTPEDRALRKPARALRVAAMEGRFEDEGWRVRKDGSRFWAHVVVTPVRDRNGTVVRFAKVTRDLSERRAAEARFQLVEAAPDGILVVDSRGVIVRANPRATTLFGYSREELIGMNIGNLVPERFRSNHRALHASFAVAPTVRMMGVATSDVVALRKDGTEFPAAISLGPQRGPDEGLVLAFIRDVADMRRLEDESIRAADRVARLQRVTAGLAGALDVDTIVRTIRSAAWEATGAAGGLLAFVVNDGCAVELVNERPGPDEDRVATARPAGSVVELVDARQRVPIDTPLPCCDVTRSGSSLWLQDLTQVGAHYPSLAPSYSAQGQKSMACLALLAQGSPIGALCLFFAEDHAFDDEERAFLLSIAEQCARALDRAQLRDVAVRAADRVARLQEATAALAGAVDIDDVASTIVSTCREAVGASAGSLALTVAGGRALETVNEVGRSSRQIEQGFAMIRATEAGARIVNGQQRWVRLHGNAGTRPKTRGIRCPW